MDWQEKINYEIIQNAIMGITLCFRTQNKANQ